MPTIYITLLILSYAPHLLLSYTLTPYRRILHPAFLPSDSPPPSHPPSPQPSTPPKYPFTSTASPFFPDYPSPPPPPSPPETTATFPANISSLTFPHASRPKPHFPTILSAAAISAAVVTLLIVAGILFFRRKQKASHANDDNDNDTDNNNADKGGRQSNGEGSNRVPKLRTESTPSSEFLYLGTLVNSRGVSNNGGKDENLGSARKPVDSPELRPLPPLVGRGCEVGFKGCDEDDEFYSPRVSVCGREGECVNESSSRRLFEGSVEESDGVGRSCGSSSSSCSSSSRLGSSSLSPPVSLSPKRMDGDDLHEQPRKQYDSEMVLDVSDHSSSVSSPGSLSPERVIDINLNVLPRGFNCFEEHKQSDSLGTSPEKFESALKQPCLNGSTVGGGAAVPPPPPPPPQLQSRRQWEIPGPRAGPPTLVCPSRPFIMQNSARVSAAGLPPGADGLENHNEETPKPVRKRLHWDKVRASSDREMVWDHLRSNSFKLNEERFETLFVVNAPASKSKETTRHSVLPSHTQVNQLIDPKKSQNIAILLRALNVTLEEVCEALLEGNADALGIDFLESLLKMAPTKEEERKLKNYNDSPIRLGPAETFLKAVLDIPFAFKRVDALLYIANFDAEVEYLKKSCETLEAACEELRNSRMFLKLLEAVLKTGNRMNVGTVRGEAQAFKLDTLLKLVDVKGADGKTTLLHFVVQEIIKSEGARFSAANQTSNTARTEDAKCKKLGLQVVSRLSSELSNVRKAAALDSDVLNSDISKLYQGISNIREVLQLIETVGSNESSEKFLESMNKFMKKAEGEITHIQAQENVALSLVKEITEYFHDYSAKEEAHRLRIFMVVRDFLTILDRVCKEVGMLNEQTFVSSVHKGQVAVNPTLPPAFSTAHVRQQYSSSDDESSS